MSKDKSLIIIGAGIAGLSAGCYAQMNGFASEIYEMHNAPGGLCTAWKRKGYTFDGCIHWLVGSSPTSSLYPLWEELGMIQDKEFFCYDYFMQTIDGEGHRFITYTHPDAFEAHMMDLAGEDEKLIKQITRDMRAMMKLSVPMDPGLGDLPKLFAMLRMVDKYAMPISELSARFKNPVLRNLFHKAFDWHDMSAFFLLWTLALMGSGDGGYPIGGSIPLAKSLEARYLGLGGKITYDAKVDKILVENDKAVGIRLTDGTEQRGDLVLSAADGHTTLFDWLEERYLTDKLRGYYKTLEPFPPLVYVSLGVNADYSQEPISLTYPLQKPITIGGKEFKQISFENRSFDKTLAPEGKSALCVMLTADYDYWAGLKGDRGRYLAEKEQIADSVIGGLAELYPAIGSQVEVIDIATPLTFERYTGNWRASYEGWLMTKDTMRLQMPVTLPGLKGFYMAGQWVAPGGGLPGAAQSARSTLKLLCKNEKRKFVTTKP